MLVYLTTNLLRIIMGLEIRLKLKYVRSLRLASLCLPWKPHADFYFKMVNVWFENVGVLISLCTVHLAYNLK